VGHTADIHKCPITEYGSRKPCFHTPKKCVNYKGRHLTISNKCPKKWENIREILQPKPRLLVRVEIPIRTNIRSSPPIIGPIRKEYPIPISSTPTPMAISISPLPSIELLDSTPKDIEIEEPPLPKNSQDTQDPTQYTTQALSSSIEREEENNSSSPIVNVNPII